MNITEKIEKYLNESNISKFKDYEVYDLIDDLSLNKHTKKFIDDEAVYDDQIHKGRGIPITAVMLALGITEDEVKKVISIIKKNTDDYNGSIEIEGGYLTINGGD